MLFATLGLVLILAMLVLLLVRTSVGAVQRVERHAEDARLEAIADAAIDLGVHALWSRYRASLGEDDEVTYRTFQAFLDEQGFAAHALADEGQADFDVFGALGPDVVEWTDLLPLAGLATDRRGNARLDGARIHRLDLLRQDARFTTAMRLRATVSFSDTAGRHLERDVERLYLAGGETFHGFDFAVMANNVNCIMCHAAFDSADRYYNRDPALRGTFPRVRVGTLESLKIRASSASSIVAGTLYTRGPLMDKDGTVLASLAGSSLVSARFDAEGRLAESAVGALVPTPFVRVVGDPLPAMGNLYLGYPRDEEEQTDGPFPEEFPPVFRDEDDDRLVDPEEYALLAAEARGSLRGGTKVLVPAGGTYAEAALPAWDRLGEVSRSVAGNVVLVGTAADPLVIEGDVAVDGDVVLCGVVRGAGQILARNNVYVVGCLDYRDGTGPRGERTFGVAADGTQNRWTIAAGGSVLVGDFLSSKGGTALATGTRTGEFNFTMSEIVIFNQMEWSRTQPTLPGRGGGPVANPLHDPAWRPRYYLVRPDNAVVVYNKGDTYFSPTTRTWLGKEHLSSWSDTSLSTIPQGNPALQGAALVALLPEGGWLSPGQLRAMWDATAAAHGGGPLRVDAFLYTSNAIVLVVNKGSVYGGAARINGGLVGADLGILVPGNGGVGLQLNFDARHRGVLDLEEQKRGELVLRRGVRLR